MLYSPEIGQLQITSLFVGGYCVLFATSSTLSREGRFRPLQGLSEGYPAGIIKDHAMGKLILVRHGESCANRLHVFAEDHTPLTDLGRMQAHQVAGRIAARFHPAALVASPLERARQTAEIIGRELGLAVEVMPGLEESDFGVLKGQSYEAYRSIILSDPTF